MRGLLAKAVVVAALLSPLCAHAQSRGASRSFAGSAGFHRFVSAAPRGPVVTRSARPAVPSTYNRRIGPPSGRGTSLINPGESACLLNGSYAGSLYCRQYNSGRSALGYQAVYPYWFPSGGSDTDQSAPPPPQTEQDPLANQVGNLAAEVESLREDQARRDSQGPVNYEPPSPAQEMPPTTVLVYRDGHKVEVQNYAIAGKTLWVFFDQRTRQIPLAELDLPATQRVNEDHGVDFDTPDPR